MRVYGSSMTPALKDRQWVCVNTAAYAWARPDRFDVAWFDDPSRPGERAVKRVIGRPGETVRIDGLLLIVDGVTVPQPFVRKPLDSGDHYWQLGEGEYVLLGDNRAYSTDSRAYGPVRLENIRGSITLCRVESWRNEGGGRNIALEYPAYFGW